MTSIRDPAKAHALNQELSALLDKGAIEPIDPLSRTLLSPNSDCRIGLWMSSPRRINTIVAPCHPRWGATLQGLSLQHGRLWVSCAWGTSVMQHRGHHQLPSPDSGECGHSPPTGCGLLPTSTASSHWGMYWHSSWLCCYGLSSAEAPPLAVSKDEKRTKVMYVTTVLWILDDLSREQILLCHLKI